MISKTTTESPTPGLPQKYRPRQSSEIWRATPPNTWKRELAEALLEGAGSQAPGVYFRADDIGAGGRPFEALCALFREHAVPLAMAVVPAWLSDSRCEQLFRTAPLDEPLWNWHQHGWRHVNWQRTGKKSEFGEQRPYEKQLRDISQGQEKMVTLFGEHLLSVFTPPWNRLSATTIKVIQELNFKGVSMMGPFPRGARPGNDLRNLRVQVDLHTRKGRDGREDFLSLCRELAGWTGRRDPVGIMIHHQRMNGFAFEFLGELLQLLKNRMGARFLSFRELLEKEDDA